MPSSHLNNGDSAGGPSQHRSKHPRPNSPLTGPSTSTQLSSETRPAPKRARKAINCEPCRNSKLKCDRNRPCSSCILRGTTASCYQGQEVDPSPNARDEAQYIRPALVTMRFRELVRGKLSAPPRRYASPQTRIDPGVEFNRIRLSLTLLENHIYQNPGSRSTHLPPIQAVTPGRRSSSSASYQYNEPPRDLVEFDPGPSSGKNKLYNLTTTPGMLGQQGNGGFYAGPTSALSHLMTAEKEEPEVSEVNQISLFDRFYSDTSLGPSVPSSGTATPTTIATQLAYDEDLFAMLPPLPTVDGLIEYYFEYCNWIYRHVNQPSFLAGWLRYKSGESGDRLVLATVCVIISLSVRYLPPGHPLVSNLVGTTEELGSRYYNVMLDTLSRYRDTMRKEGLGKGYTLELVELLLLRGHYLTFAKEDPEETWCVRGELVSIGTALGLHRDPGGTKFERGVAERRRWAWWHILLLERWQAFMFGRPPAISARHYNTRLPSYCDPGVDKTGRLYLPNLALFRLAYLLGNIMEDAVSFRPVSYSTIQEHDRQLVLWMEALPPELDLDEYRIARYLASPDNSVRRLGVQSVIIRSAYYHIRFTLHRPYAHIPTSLETAVGAAGQLISLVGQTRADFLSNSALAVPGHMNWGPFHVFSAAMFFSFQLIAHPDQPAVKLFRENVRKAFVCLEQSSWMPIADKALTILEALKPLHSDEFLQESQEERERKKAQVLKLVKTLAFPYQDVPYTRTGETPDTKNGDSPATFSSTTPIRSGQFDPLLSHQMVPSQTQLPVSSMRWIPNVSEVNASPSYHTSEPQLFTPGIPCGIAAPPPPPPAMAIPSQSVTGLSSTINTYTDPSYSFPTSVAQPGVAAPDAVAQVGTQLVHPADEGSMWGASMGFGMGEWQQFMSAMQRPDSGSKTNHLG